MIHIDSDEFKAWHEVGHATVCLHLGGDLDCIEFLDEDERGFAMTYGCYVEPENEKSVACGGFATEFYLLKSGCVDGVNLNDPRGVEEVSARVFSNAWRDHQDFIGREVTEDNCFTKEEEEEFMNYAIEQVTPILNSYIEKMSLVVSELISARSISGVRVREILDVILPQQDIN